MTSIQKSDQSSNARVFVRGLPVRIEKEAIVEFFSQFGTVDHCKLKRNNKTKRSMGYACITFRDSQVAQSLIDRPLDFHGRVCECKPVLKTKDLEQHLTREKRLKVKLAGLDPKTTNQDLLQALSALTSFAYAYVVKEQPDCEENKGFGFVMFNNEQEVDAFCKNFRQLAVRGRKVQVASEEYSLQPTDQTLKATQKGQTGSQPADLRAVGSGWRASPASSERSAPQSHGVHTADTRPQLRQSKGPFGWPHSESQQTGAAARLRPQASFFSLWSPRASSRHISAGSQAAQGPASRSGQQGSSPSHTAGGSYRSLSRSDKMAYLNRQIDERVENYRFNPTPNSPLGKKPLRAAMPSQPAPPKFLRTCSGGDITREQACAV
jgi:RNA recognition motif-containing protein